MQKFLNLKNKVSSFYILVVFFLLFLIFQICYNTHIEVESLKYSIKARVQVMEIHKSRKSMPYILGRLINFNKKNNDSKLYRFTYYEVDGKEYFIGQFYPVWFNTKSKYIISRFEENREKMIENYTMGRNKKSLLIFFLILIATFLQYVFNEMEKEKNNKKKVFSILLLLSIAGLDLSAQSPKDTRGDQIILAVSNKAASVFTQLSLTYK